jgi:hypothetical protein
VYGSTGTLELGLCVFFCSSNMRIRGLALEGWFVETLRARETNTSGPSADSWPELASQIQFGD